MPLHTPSPYRFVKPTRPDAGTPAESSVRQSQPLFNSTPRFTLKSATSKEDIPNEAIKTPIIPSLLPKTRGEEIEEVEDAADKQARNEWIDEDDMLLDQLDASDDESNLHESSTRRPKRTRDELSSSPLGRRPTTPIMVSSSPRAESISPRQPPSNARFLPASTPLRPHHPIFRLPEADDTAPVPPLSELFSPHSRVKYLPGGLASTIRDWILEVRGQIHWKDAAAGRIRVVEVIESSRLVTVVDGRGERWMLIQGRVGFGNRDTIAVGQLLMVRKPTWKVQLEGISWHVGTTWDVVGNS